MDRIDSVVIGAGAIGLAIARGFAMAGRSVIILERERRFGMGISSRNSEVIHAGLYYAAGSLKERLCIAGRDRLYAFCATRGVPHRRCGKLILAAEECELPGLDAIAARARSAGIDDLVGLNRKAVKAIEPDVDCAAALLSPSTGIIDGHAYMLALLAEAEDHAALLACGSAVERIERKPDGWIVRVGDTALAASVVVNAAGLDAQAVAATIDRLDPRFIPRRYLAKGCYFTYSGKVPFTRLIYPLPVPGGLGTHLTLDLAGAARFGPDVEWVDTVDHDVDPALKPRFVAAAQRIWPAIDPEKLHPGYAGIRPKISGRDDPAADFMIQGEDAHGLPGLVNLFGIESPGLTASLAIADRVLEICGSPPSG